MASLVYSKEFFNKVKELFGRYIITKEEFHENWMGNEKSGNFAKVTKGTFRGKQVALKKIKLTKDSVKSLMKDQNELSSILTELSILTKVNNDNIPKLEGIYILEDKLELFFLLQFIDGSTLQDLFLNKVHWNYQQKLLIAYRIAKILVYITSEGVIHRDVKPENIMIENDSNLEPYLIDFGFSKIKQSDKQYTFTSAKCTPLYSPPENIYTDDCYAEQIGSTLDSLQMKIDDSLLTKISYKVDVWSFGCVLFELFSGKLPWMYLFSNLSHALTVKDILDKFSKNYTLYSQEDKKNFPEIINIVEHCTKTNVNQRWEITKVFQEVEKLVHKQRYVDKEEIDNSIYNGELIKIIDNDGNSTTLYDGEGKLITEMDDEESKVIYGGNYEYGNKANFGVEIGNNYKYIGNWRTHLKNGFGYFWINEYDQDCYYIGSFKKDKKDGYGYLVNGNESVSQGLFCEDMLVEGIRYDKEENKIYKGKFDSDLFIFGEVKDLNSREVYYGKYNEKKKHGYGYIELDGNRIKEGKWNNDVLVKQL